MLLRLKLWLGAAGLFAAALAASWLGGRKQAKTDAKLREVKDYVETRKRIDSVDVGDDPAVLRDFLRERGQSKRNL
jgi:hypothetical protein